MERIHFSEERLKAASGQMREIHSELAQQMDLFAGQHAQLAAQTPMTDEDRAAFDGAMMDVQEVCGDYGLLADQMELAAREYGRLLAQTDELIRAMKEQV